MKSIYSFLFCLLLSTSSWAQLALNSDSLAADFCYLVQQLEATHPDPYTGFGGKVFFHKQAFELENELRKQSSCTLAEFWEKSMAFLASLQDGHTYLMGLSKQEQLQQRFLSVQLRTLPDGVVLQGVPEAHKELLGSMLLGVNEQETAELLAGTALFRASENLYDCYHVFCCYFPTERFLHRLIPDLKENITLHLRTPAGQEVTLELPFLSHEERGKVVMACVPNREGIPTEQLAYRFIDDKKQVMFLKVNSIMARDNFEFMYQAGWGDLHRQLDSFYQQQLKQPMPADTAQAIQAIPSFSGVFAEMLKEMKKEQAPCLVIDLRGNSGGWTPIVHPTLYQLYGDRYLQTDFETAYYRIISPLYMKKMNTTLEEFNQEHQASYQWGDYTFKEAIPGKLPIDTLRSNFLNRCMSSVKDELYAQEGQPVYEPEQVYVVTDERTFSAAFHYAYFLWKMGATIVGVPSGQAPNTFMEQTLFKLPYTGLNGSISNTMQQFLPGKDRRAKIFWPDWMPTREDYQKYNFDQQSEILYLLDRIKQEGRVL